jgi:hypothetical protein
MILPLLFPIGHSLENLEPVVRARIVRDWLLKALNLSSGTRAAGPKLTGIHIPSEVEFFASEIIEFAKIMSILVMVNFTRIIVDG